MKLYEIKTVEPKGHFRHPRRAPLGHGIQGVAHAHPKQPNVVVKTATLSDPEHDPYVQFINLAMEHQNNPFFPRIYSAKIVKAPKDTFYLDGGFGRRKDWEQGDPEEGQGYQLIVTMEKLVEFKDSKVTDAATDLLIQLGVPSDVAKGTRATGELFTYLNNSFTRKELADSTQNEQFAEALRLLKPFIEYWGQDMHTGNWMVRLTGHGPQLVIIDPLQPE